MAASHKPLSLSRALAFAGIGIPLAAVGLPMAVYVIPYYAEDLGVGVAATGTIFMFLRLWDLITDPAMGYLVDTRPSRFGRIRHWIWLAVPVLALAAYFIYMPKAESVGVPYLAGWLLVFYVGFTMLQTPHFSWVPAIAPGYDERSRLFMWFAILETIAMLGILLAPAILSLGFGLEFTRRQEVWWMGLFLIISLPVTVAIATKFVPDPPLPGSTGQAATFTPAALRAAVSDISLGRVLISYICVGIAVSSTAATFLWAAKFGFGLTHAAPLVLAIFFVSGFSCLPLWVAFSKRTEKHTTFGLICLVTALSYLSYFPLSYVGGFWAMTVGAVISGNGFTAAYVLARSMVADLVEQEQAVNGESRAGVYYAMLSAAYKLGASFAVGIPYLLLGLIVGFDPKADNSPETIRNMMIVFTAVPTFFYLLAASLIRGYKLTRSVQQKNAEQVAASSI